ncbi:MAG: hypothetical protein ACE5EA_11540, partial [Nitrospirota bacterium]
EFWSFGFVSDFGFRYSDFLSSLGLTFTIPLSPYNSSFFPSASVPCLYSVLISNVLHENIWTASTPLP